jgi:LysR family transcriptional activator of nhaA
MCSIDPKCPGPHAAGAMEWLNYHHLLYFWLTAKEGSVTVAARRLRLAQPTVSGQIRLLEAALGSRLLERRGRGLELTARGRTVFEYANEIFQLGQELLRAVREDPAGIPMRLVVGVADVLPKLVVYRLLAPALKATENIRLVVREDPADRLLAELALHAVDLVLADSPIAPNVNVRAFNHLLGESPLGFFAEPRLAKQLQRGFPDSLDGAPFLLPGQHTVLRRSLDAWLESNGIRPRIVGEFEDSALVNAFGQAGTGVFVAPTAIEAEVRRQHQVRCLGRAGELTERIYAISLERRIKHPGILAISEGARELLAG